MSRSVLITGGAGFIGTHLCSRLCGGGAKVRVLDLRAPEAPVPGVEYVRGDVRNRGVLSQAMAGIDDVFHFAAMVSVPRCQEQPLESYEVNLVSTTLLLEAIRSERDRSGRDLRMIFASTAALYGHAGREGIGVREDEGGGEPLSFYGAQKLASEHAIRLFHRDFGIPAIALRFFNVFGPGQDPDSPYSGVISIFAKRLRVRQPLLLNGGGRQTRDFVSVHDIVAGCEAVLGLSKHAFDGSAVNLGSGRAVTISELAERMNGLVDFRVLIEGAPARSGDVLHSVADISRARELIGWAPKVSLQEGLQEILS